PLTRIPRREELTATAPGSPASVVRQRATEYGWPRALWSLVTGDPAKRTIKPRGHSAWVEASLEIIVPIAAGAFSFAAAYALAEKNLELISTALAAGQGLPFLATLLLAIIVVTGLLMDAALLTAASRFRMHVVRREGGWAFIQAAMLLLCVVVEGTTAAYLYYRLDPTAGAAPGQAFLAVRPAGRI